MAKNYAGMDTEELKALAEEQKQRQAALNQLARSDPSAMKAMTANERVDFLNQRNQERTDAWHAANDKARATRLKDMLGTEGGRYSPVTIAAARKYLEENGYGQEGERRRQRDEEQKTLRLESENKKLGMIGQGSEAAKHNAEGAIGAATITANANKEIEAGKRAAEKYLGELDAKTKEKLANIKADSDYDVADITGQHNEAAAKYGADSAAATVMSKQLMDKYKVDTLSGDRQAAIIQRAKKGDQDAIAKLRKSIVDRIGNGDVDELTIEQAEEMARGLGFSLSVEDEETTTPRKKKTGGTSQFLRK